MIKYTKDENNSKINKKASLKNDWFINKFNIYCLKCISVVCSSVNGIFVSYISGYLKSKCTFL